MRASVSKNLITSQVVEGTSFSFFKVLGVKHKILKLKNKYYGKNNLLM